MHAGGDELARAQPDHVGGRKERHRRPASIGDVHVEHNEPGRRGVAEQAHRRREVVLERLPGQQQADPAEPVAGELVLLDLLIHRADDQVGGVAVRISLDSRDDLGQMEITHVSAPNAAWCVQRSPVRPKEILTPAQRSKI